MARTMRALGLMSGTLMDGIDVALIETDGHRVEYRGWDLIVYEVLTRVRIHQLVSDIREISTPLSSCRRECTGG